MSVNPHPSGAHPIRHDRLLQEQVHDVYYNSARVRSLPATPPMVAMPNT